MRSAWFLGCALWLVSSTSHAAVHRVPLQHATIQGALDLASEGDTILVAPGTYTGAGNRNLEFSIDLVVRSEAGPEVTIIDVEGHDQDPGRGFLITRVSPAAILDGFTIVNGFLFEDQSEPTAVESDAEHDLSGAGIMLRLSASPTIRNCIIRDCHSDFTGGGIGVEFGSAPHIENCVVSGCTSGVVGGGLSAETGGFPTLVGSTFTGNRSNHGGGAHFSGAGATVTSCLFAGNTGERRGGGVDVIFGTSVQLVRSVVWNNCSPMGPDVFADPAIALPDGGALQIECSAVDTSGVDDTNRVIEWVGENVSVDPQFCGPVPCQNAPTNAGEYAVRESSPLLGANNACGETIGPQTAGCGASPVRDSSWGRVKSLYRR